MRTDAPTSSAGDETAIAVALLAVVLLILGTVGAWNLGTWLDTGHFGFGHWSNGHVVTFLLLILILIGALYLLGRAHKRHVDKKHSVDRKAELMGDPKGLSREAAQASADIGRMMWDEQAAPGLEYGAAVVDGTRLFMDWRSTGFFEVGPGGMKSTALIIPMVDQAPGNCVVTSMKRDVPDAVRWLCENRGQCFIFDPMPICDYYHGQEPPWWWNPLSDVDGPVAANRLATIFAEATAPIDSTKHPFFDVKGPELLACLCLAAATEGLQIDQVYKWVQDPLDDWPVRILEKPYPLSAAFLRGIYKMTGDSKGDLFATAGNAIGWMTDPHILAWITDRTGRPEFNPRELVKPYRIDHKMSKTRKIKRDTLILMSRKGDGSVTPIASALMASMLKAATTEAARHAHGRLPVPLVMPMDELPNTAPIPTLPDDFTVLGSHGVTPVLCVQNWAQATRAWKESGAKQLWDAATTRGVGGGLADAQRLESIVKLTGQRWEVKQTASSGNGAGLGQTVSVGMERAPILDVDELHGLDEGRFVALTSGNYAVLARFVPWWERPDLAWKVEKSLALYEPKGVVTV